MDVILMERVDKLGEFGDLVRVRPGFARNYLLPSGKALHATPENKARFEAERAQIKARNQEKRANAEEQLAGMSGSMVVLIRSASESGQLYGSVTGRDIAKAVTEQIGLAVKKTQIPIEKPFKTLGIFEQTLRLHAEIETKIQLNIAQSEEEAEKQKEALEREALEKEALEREALESASEKTDKVSQPESTSSSQLSSTEESPHGGEADEGALAKQAVSSKTSD